MAFGIGLKKEEVAQAPTVDTDMVSLLRRLRVLEERYGNLRKKAVVIEQNQIIIKNQIQSEIKSIDMEMVSLKKEYIDIDSKINLIQKELENLADAHEIRYLTKYLEFFSPANLITVKELDKRIESRK